MRITCPSCAAEYSVPGPLAAGRIVRCARCGSEWAPVPLPSPIAEPPPLPEPVPQPVPQPVPEPIRPAPEPPAPLAPARPAMPSNKAPLLLAWTGSLVLIAALVAAAFVWRDPIMERWPPSIRVYAAMGLTARP